ncbi:MAG TPA: acetoin utilization protein AcuC [Thermodesulfobacteriota bacterium]|nr:acetoin utilization protein AcuC [Thermodesulfobacteriota bacterium]
MEALYLYDPRLADYDYGEAHPLKMRRLRLAYELTRACGLLDAPGIRQVVPRMATEAELLVAHDPTYLRVLAEAESGRLPPEGPRYGLGPWGDNPVFPGLWTVARTIAGGSLEAADRVAAGEVRVAMWIAGGLHHALRDRASGFCYLNDPVLAIHRLLERGLSRIAYIDIDAHHGDGVEFAFEDDDRVLTISLHQDGRTLFPGTGFVEDIGKGRGRGYAVNVPLLPGADDAVIVEAFEAVVPPFLDAFRPDAVVAQLGVDAFATDPLAQLQLTTVGFEAMVRRIAALAPRLVALGGGGYNLGNVARGWTLAWAVVTGQTVPDTVPASMREALRREGYAGDRMRDPGPAEWQAGTGVPLCTPAPARVREAARAACAYLLREALPLVRAGRG